MRDTLTFSFLDLEIDPKRYDGDTRFRIETTAGESASLEEHALSILDQISAAQNEVEIDFNLGHRWVFTVYYYSLESTVHFTGEVLRRIAATFPNICIEISSVQLFEENEEDEDSPTSSG